MTEPALPTLKPGTKYEGPPELQEAYFQTPFPPAPLDSETAWEADLAPRTRPGVVGPAWDAEGALQDALAETAPDWEQLLLGAALASDEGVEALWGLDKLTGPVERDNQRSVVMEQPQEPLPTRAQIAVDVAKEFVNGSHGQLARIVMEQHARGLPHGADACIAVLRERNVLPLEWDPEIPKVPIDRTQYGIAGWESNSILPAEQARSYAAKVREAYRPRYLAEVGRTATELGEAAISDPTQVTDGMRRVAKLLDNAPPRLDPHGRPAPPIPLGSVDTSWDGFPEQGPPKMTRPILPEPPVLSSHGRVATHR